jgi:cytochrome P450
MTSTDHEIVTDYPVTYFDYTEGTHRSVGDSMAQFDVLRSKYPTFLRSTAAPQGFWVMTSCEAIRDAYQRPDIFSNSAVMVWDPEPTEYFLIPEMIDPPLHTKWRQLTAQWFSPAAIAKREETVRSRCIELIEGLKDRHDIDYVKDFAQQYPTSIFLDIMGIGSEHLNQFMEWEDDILHLPQTSPENQKRTWDAQHAVMEMFREISIERRAHPTGNDDLVAFFLLMFEAGLDTVTNELSYATWHLATHPEDRQRILDDPALIPFAIEEFLRYYAIVTPSRKAMADVVHHGCPIKKGDMVYLPLAAATRDPREFPEADRVVIDRSPNNHIAFGAGPHRCLGSHLARREMRIALEEWHKRIPSYEVPEGADVPEYIGVQMGIQSLPLRLH